jgi:nicotinate-nucleotide adenylyltransferase
MPAPEPGQQWGILGGTFDPVHRGHLSLGREILKAKQLDGILLVPSYDPPHRESDPTASFEERLAMLRLAVAGDPAFAISTIEETTSRPSYTLNTVRALRNEHPGVEFFFIVGADNLSLLRTWHCWETVLQEIRLLVGTRPGANLAAADQFAAKAMELVPITEIDVSSTEIRSTIKKVATVGELCELTPRAVAEYIVERGLYL